MDCLCSCWLGSVATIARGRLQREKHRCSGKALSVGSPSYILHTLGFRKGFEK